MDTGEATAVPTTYGMVEWNSARTVCLSDVVHMKPKARETYSCAGHCKQTVQGP